MMQNNSQSKSGGASQLPQARDALCQRVLRYQEVFALTSSLGKCPFDVRNQIWRTCDSSAKEIPEIHLAVVTQVLDALSYDTWRASNGSYTRVQPMEFADLAIYHDRQMEFLRSQYLDPSSKSNADLLEAEDRWTDFPIDPEQSKKAHTDLSVQLAGVRENLSTQSRSGDRLVEQINNVMTVFWDKRFNYPTAFATFR